MSKHLAHNPASKHTKELLLLFSVPIAIIFLLIAFLYIPRAFANPSYNFIYCDGYSCDGAFSVDSSGKITGKDTNVRYSNAQLYYYDVKRDSSRPLQLEEAKQYNLDPMSKSPDSYTLKRSSSSGGFLFWGSYSSGWSLSKEIASKPTDLGTTNADKFIGWVLP